MPLELRGSLMRIRPVSEIGREPTPESAIRRTEERVPINQNLAGGAKTR
jgi:hypothetical protein